MSTSSKPIERFVKVSGIGPDKPGIIHHISRTIAGHGGSIMLLRSMRVANDYAVTLVAAFANGTADSAESAMQALRAAKRDDGFFLVAAEVDRYENPQPAGVRHRVTVDGPDRTGIIESISYCFVEYGLNIDSMESESVFMPFQGFRTFRSEFWTRIPENIDVDGFAAEVDRIARENGLTSNVKPAE